MKVLMVNKFLYPNGGSEAYMFRLGNQLEAMGHDVQYFGMENEGRCVSNAAELYTTSMNFHGGSKLKKITYPVKTIYSHESMRKMRKVLDDFKPDAVHLNNFNYQLTPTVILAAADWSRRTGHKCRIVYTAHDYQLVCPNHMCYRPLDKSPCEECLNGGFSGCIKHRCIHGSAAKSAVGWAEAAFWRHNNVYEKLDAVICCSQFMKSKLDTNPTLCTKTTVMHNFINSVPHTEAHKSDYVL